MKTALCEEQAAVSVSHIVFLGCCGGFLESQPLTINVTVTTRQSERQSNHLFVFGAVQTRAVLIFQRHIYQMSRCKAKVQVQACARENMTTLKMHHHLKPSIFKDIKFTGVIHSAPELNKVWEDTECH